MVNLSMLETFKEQLGNISTCFETWKECEKAAALCFLLKKLPDGVGKFLSNILLMRLKDSVELRYQEGQANNIAAIKKLEDEDGETLIDHLLLYFPLLSPMHGEAGEDLRREYISLVETAIQYHYNEYYDKCRQLISYALIHPALNRQERQQLLKCTPILDEVNGKSCDNGGDICGPVSPQNSNSSSGGSCHEDIEFENWGSKNSFTEPGSGMKDVPAWLKTLRLHKYSYLFSQLSYEEMMSLDEAQLEKRGVTQGARHKIILSIANLHDNQHRLCHLEELIVRNVDNNNNIRSVMAEIRRILSTPIKAFQSPSHLSLSSRPGSCEENRGIGNFAPLANDSNTLVSEAVLEGDVPGQLTRTLGKLCTSLLLTKYPEDDLICSFLSMLERCQGHEAFTESQKLKMNQWKVGIQKHWRPMKRVPSSDSIMRWNNQGGYSDFSKLTAQSQHQRLESNLQPRTDLSSYSFHTTPPPHIMLARHRGQTTSLITSSDVSAVTLDAQQGVHRTKSAPSRPRHLVYTGSHRLDADNIASIEDMTLHFNNQDKISSNFNM